MIDEIISLAKGQVGVTETPPGSNHVIYNTEYYGGEISGDAYPWCCVFIWWLFARLGASALFCGGQKTAYCPFVVNYAKEHDQWVVDNYQPGDLVFFDWNGDGVADHIGLVTGTSGASVYTVEGNVAESVKAMQRTVVTILGAYRPHYKDEPKPEPKPTPDTPNTYTVVKGDTLWGIAERFLGAGERYIQIMRANGLNDSWVYPGQVLIIPNGNVIYKTIQITITEDTYTLLSIMADGWNKTIGQVIDAMMEDAV